MAKNKKKKKKAAKLTVAGFTVPKPIARSLTQFTDSALGREVIAEALVHAAHVLVTKYPRAAIASAGAGAGAAAKSAAETAAHSVASVMHGAADRLKAGLNLGNGDEARRGDDADDRPARRAKRSKAERDEIVRAVLAELSRKDLKRLSKTAAHH